MRLELYRRMHTTLQLSPGSELDKLVLLASVTRRGDDVMNNDKSQEPNMPFTVENTGRRLNLHPSMYFPGKT